MNRVKVLSVILVLVFPYTVSAGVISLTNNASDIALNGLIDWNVLGPPGTAIPNASFTIDILGTPFVATVSEPPLPPAGYNPPSFRYRAESDGFLVMRQDTRQTYPNYLPDGHFQDGAPVLYTGSDGYNNLGFEFSSPVRGFGLQVHST
ncbi:MAG: hypothetical protein ACYTGQ_07555, partial [Planctomycetota bacterium]